VIIGVGVDTVDLARFGRALERTPALRARLFGESDIAELGEGSAEVSSLAARFAAKEAALKALGGNIPGFSWHDIQVERQPGRAPTLKIRGGALSRATELGATRWHLSLSHDGPIATALVVAEGPDHA